MIPLTIRIFSDDSSSVGEGDCSDHSETDSEETDSEKTDSEEEEPAPVPIPRSVIRLK